MDVARIVKIQQNNADTTLSLLLTLINAMKV